ncbi:protein disabled isoform X2 [Periplaneta americana]|uniref:protein disabled isoform X2 n=1 Tax=Periplaneta americana TaxID=6978 RepID=UPI0037E94ABC
MQTLRKKTSPCKYKNEPSRFLGEGVSFKAKLIGILEVSEARGDRMCQEALADLKMAIRAAGEHKQRITINIAIDGLRLRDEKTGDCLYHHPVHKISFIAQDMSDSRAFGYIFGSPDTGHRFFGIKTDKAASQVVIAMRDLFQVVFELKKKEIEMAKQHIEQHQIKLGGSLFMDSSGSNSKNGASSSDQTAAKMRTIQEDSVKENGTLASSGKSAQQTSEVIADLLDLEFELNSIQQGIHQMERITPSDPFGPSTAKEDPFGNDPFGDSFTPDNIFPLPKTTKATTVTILPPPPSAKDSTRSSDPFNVPPPARHPQRRHGTRGTASEPTKPPAASAPVQQATAPVVQQEKHWFDQETESLFDEGELITPPMPAATTTATTTTSTTSTTSAVPVITPKSEQESSGSPPSQPSISAQFDVFTELDPLGTGRSKPYVDRKDFFQELKNPPKKVLKDLVTEAPASEATAPLFQATFETGSSSVNANDGVASTGEVVLSATEPATTNSSVTVTTTTPAVAFPASKGPVVDVDPFSETDPFYKTDPFTEDDFSQICGFPPLGGSQDPFDTGFADFTMFGKGRKSDMTETSKETKRSSPLPQSETTVPSPATFHGPLRVSLPPEPTSNEVFAAIPPYPSTARPVSMHAGTLTKTRSKTQRLHKQATMSGMVKLPSPKSMQRSNHRVARQMTVDVCGSMSNPLHPSPTPPTPPTPPRSDRRSPSSQGILESITLRNRGAITPSPPVVACFPDIGDGDSASRLSGSSAELAEIAPEPPPRPAANITAIKPPPLPPKRQQAGTMIKPPPRPPHTDEHPHYDYIENYETSSSPTLQDVDELKSPPIPVPARRPRFGDSDFGTVPQRPRRQPPAAAPLSKFDDNDYLPPFPLLPPPQKKSPASDPSKNGQTAKPRPPAATTIASLLQSAASATTTTAAVVDEQPSKLQQTKSLDITLSQLTKTGLADLAATLGVSPGHLSNMTLQDLTKCLSQLSSTSQDEQGEESKPESETIKRDKYATLRESVDEEPMFKAEFETTESTDDVFQEAPFDKYAVFRELMVEESSKEETETTTVTTTVMTTTTTTTTTATSSASITTTTMLSTPISACADESKSPLQSVTETVVEEPTPKSQAEDRYAALREISLQDIVPEKEEVDTSSDKEEGEVTKMDDDYDLLTLSRQQSEGTESPTLEVATVREPQSIIETTILEEDVSALEADNEEETVEAAEEKTVSPTEITKEAVPEPSEEIANGSSPSEKDDAVQSSPLDARLKEEETLPAGESWAKFDGNHFATDKPASEGQSEGGVSPWSSDGKEFNKVPPISWQDQERGGGRRRRARRSAPWREDEESEEGWDDRRGEDGVWNERPWRENGWSDGESFYEEVPPVKERGYREERRGRRRRVSPWKRGQRSSRDVSPWECEGREEDEEHWSGGSKRWQERSMDEEEEEEEEYEVSWKTRPKHRGSSWDDERRRRHGSRDLNGVDYEDGRKRRPSPWRGDGDRRSSWESVSWDEDDRFPPREMSEQRRMREEEYRRRWDPDMDSRGYVWSRKCPVGEGDYMWQEQAARRRQDGHHRYYRDRSRESPWEDEFSEQGEEESPRYQGRKWNWPKRPSSASEVRRSTEKSSPGDYKARMMEKQQQQHSLPTISRTEQAEKMGGYGFTDRRYREKCGGRPRSRESYFNSDQEYEYWSHQDGRPRRMDREASYEQRAQTLQARRRYKKAHEQRAYNQKSPFDDDFSMQTFEFSLESKSQGAESDASDGAKKKSPLSTNFNVKPCTPTDAFSKRKDSQHSESEARPTEVVPSSPHDSHEDDVGKSRVSRGSSHRQSPFEDDFTPTETRMSNARLMSSISSDISDYPKSPFDDVRSSCRVESLAEESVCENEVDQKNGKSNDDVFLPAESEQKFADFENNMFDSSGEFVPSNKTSTECRRVERRVLGSMWNNEEGNKVEKHPSTMKVRMSNLMRVDSSSSLRKSESVNIFARESDPFDDDFFISEVSVATLPRPGVDQSSRVADKPNSNNNSSEHFKWTKAFDSFNFEEEK